jgi:D-glycerate 3-kinase
MSQDPPASLSRILKHVLEQHKLHVTEHASPAPPLIVGIQGPQGSGKSFLSGLLQDHLSTLPPLHAVVLSVDDLYLPHDKLRKVAEDHPSNPLLQGRGQPGTHDVKLGTELLNALHTINNPISDVQSVVIRLPVFDKSLHGGEGDRVPEDQWIAVAAPLDIIIFEGWFVGFAPCTTQHVESCYAKPVDDLKDIFDLKNFCTMDDLLEIRDRLTDYQAWWDRIDTFIQVRAILLESIRMN